jgi:hypothetical protein
MKKSSYPLFVGLLFYASVVFGQIVPPGEFDEPWKDVSRPLILDPFEGNENLNLQVIKDTEPRVAGFIHRASRCRWNAKTGRCFQVVADLKYEERRLEAKKLGFLWGSYHLGYAGVNPIRQADEYLAIAKPEGNDVMALDLEDSHGRNRKIMNLRDAAIFISRIKEKTGRYPLLYVPERVRREILSNYESQSVFSKTPLWYARYCLHLGDFFPTKFWKTYNLLQFASEINCPTTTGSDKNCPLKSEKRCPLPAPISGTDYDMDINVFNGSFEELRSQWGNFQVR